MAIIAKNTGGGDFSYQLPETGLHNAVCSKVFDMGMQEGFEGKLRHEIVIYWELDEDVKDGDFKGQPLTVFKSYTLSLHEKSTLRHDLESWRGRAFTAEEEAGFDVEKLIGAPCTLNLIAQKTNGKDRVKIAGVMPKQKGLEAMARRLPDSFMPKWIAGKIGVAKPNGTTAAEFEDDIPF
jgi:hypothetical protein